MDRDAILARIRDLLAEIVDDDSLIIAESTTARDVPWWDSLNHLKLLVSIEEEFSIKFASAELTAANNVGQLIDLIVAKT